MNFVLSAILFGNVTSVSTFSRIKKIFNKEIHKLFQNISIHPKNISLGQSPELAPILIFDKTGIAPKNLKNNLKLSSDKIYSLVYSSLPKTANSFF